MQELQYCIGGVPYSQRLFRIDGVFFEYKGKALGIICVPSRGLQRLKITAEV